MLTTILTALYGLISKLKYPVIITIIALLLLAAGIYEYKKEENLKVQLKYSVQNLLAATDSIRTVQTNDKKAEEDKLAFVVSKNNDLQKLNDSLYLEVKNTKGTVNTIVDTKVQIVHDTVQLATTTTLSDSIVKSNFNFDSSYDNGNYQAISGYTTYNLKTGKSFGLLTTNAIGLHLITGIKDLDKGTPTIFVRSDYPGFIATSIEGAILSPSLFAKQKPAKKLGIGVDLSYSPLSYNLSTAKFSLLNQVTLGLGIHYSLW